MKLRWISYLLLVSFSVLFTPRHWWHNCHERHTKEIQTDETVVKKGNCYACEYHIPFAPLALSPLRAKALVHFRVHVKSRVEQTHRSQDLSYSLRGPPSC